MQYIFLGTLQHPKMFEVFVLYNKSFWALIQYIKKTINKSVFAYCGCLYESECLNIR